MRFLDFLLNHFWFKLDDLPVRRIFTQRSFPIIKHLFKLIEIMSHYVRYS